MDVNQDDRRKAEDERLKQIHKLQYQLLLRKGRVHSLLAKLEQLRGNLWVK